MRNALVNKAPNPHAQIDWTSPDYNYPAGDNLAVLFSEQWLKAQGLFFYCANMMEVLETLIQLSSVNDWQSVVCNCAPLEPFLQSIDFPFEAFREKANWEDTVIVEPEYLVAKEGLVVLTEQLGLSSNQEFKCKQLIVLANRDHMVADWKSLLDGAWGNNTQNWPAMIYSLHGKFKVLDNDFKEIENKGAPQHIMVIFCDQGAVVNEGI